MRAALGRRASHLKHDAGRISTTANLSRLPGQANEKPQPVGLAGWGRSARTEGSLAIGKARPGQRTNLGRAVQVAYRQEAFVSALADVEIVKVRHIG